MNAQVVVLNKLLPTCSAQSETDILVVFKPPTDAHIDLGDILDFDLIDLDRRQQVENLTKKESFVADIKSADIHDLHLPSGHGTSRFPSHERRIGG